MNRFFAESINGNMAVFDKDESYHLAMVLRMEKGQEIEVICDGGLYLAEIENNDKKQATALILSQKEVISEPEMEITLFQGVPKGSKMDFVVQKCTELGISVVAPVLTKRCVAKASDSKVDRLKRIAFESCKQCKRVAVPEVYECADINDADFSVFDLIILAYEDENTISLKEVLNESNKPGRAAIIIGPEGGFEKTEVEELKNKGAKCVSLGRRILRSETAGMAVLTAMLYHYGEMEV